MDSKEIYNNYTVKNKSELQHILKKENRLYRDYMFKSLPMYLLGKLKNENVIQIMKWQRLSRICDYHDYCYHKLGLKFHYLIYLWYLRRRNNLGNRIGLEMSTTFIGSGLVIYHFNNVINGNAIIGENCHIHGTVVIGNKGDGYQGCPVIGNNVMIGAGARIIGDVFIADNIKIAAGAVVVNSFYEKGITIGGIPAHKLK